MFRKKKTPFVCCGLFIVNLLNAEEVNKGGSPFGELTRSHISRGFVVSTPLNPAADFIVTSSIAETLTGISESSDIDLTFSVFSGLLKPMTQTNADVIFLNGFE